LGYVDHVASLRNLAAGTTPFLAFKKGEFESKKRGVVDEEVG
jgi:hypothetical protein